MNQAASALIILITAMVLLGLGRRPRKDILQKTDKNHFYTINQPLSSLVEEKKTFIFIIFS